MQIIAPYFTMADTNADGKLTLAEFTAVCEELMIPASTFYNHGNSYSGIFNAIDLDGNGVIDRDEWKQACREAITFLGFFALECVICDRLKVK